MYRITLFPENACPVGPFTPIDFADHRAMYTALGQFKREAKYARILVENFIPGVGWVWYEDKRYTATDLASQRKTNKRLKEERKVFKKVVESALRLGYIVSLYDGEEYTVKRSSDKAAILAAGQTTDMDRLYFRVAATGEQVGYVMFIYGNQASEVMADWVDNEQVEAILTDAIAYTEKLSAKGE